MAKKITKLEMDAFNKPGRLRVSEGLYLRVSKWGTKSFEFRFTLDGRTRGMGLGPYPKVSLADARSKAKLLACGRAKVRGYPRTYPQADDKMTAAARQNIPQELRTYSQWVCHDADKRPINPHTGQLADVSDPTTWGTSEQGCCLVTPTNSVWLEWTTC